MDLDNFLIFFILSFGFVFYKYFFIFLKKFNQTLLIDDQFEKPQAFHLHPIPTTGGTGIMLSFLVVYFYSFFFKNTFYFEYLSFGLLFFLLGFMEDLKINLRPNIRLILMILVLVFLVKFYNFYLERTGVEFLNIWLQNSEIFSIFFVCLCFLFIVNGANLIDGYNGLLGIHSLIIFTILFFINYMAGNQQLTNLLLYGILILTVFLIFNFPKAKLFLGDSGSYFLGSFIAISTIKTSIAIPKITPFFFCMLLFYLFFEVFFSFFRKIFIEKRSPLFPDHKHLHMLIYQILYGKSKDKHKSNYNVSIIINSIYLLLIMPAFFFMYNGLISKYYALIFFIIYFFSYRILCRRVKKTGD